jgi:hypothetical protein
MSLTATHHKRNTSHVKVQTMSNVPQPGSPLRCQVRLRTISRRWPGGSLISQQTRDSDGSCWPTDEEDNAIPPLAIYLLHTVWQMKATYDAYQTPVRSETEPSEVPKCPDQTAPIPWLFSPDLALSEPLRRFQVFETSVSPYVEANVKSLHLMICEKTPWSCVIEEAIV